MPYIKQWKREYLDEYIVNLSGYISEEGDLNYVISRLCYDYIKKIGLKYKIINAVMGVLSCAKMELYRMIAVPYEDEKIKVNGPLPLP